MRERATLKLSSGGEVAVEVDRDDLARASFVVRRVDATPALPSELLETVRAHLATTHPRAAGTTDRLLAADRDRPY